MIQRDAQVVPNRRHRSHPLYVASGVAVPDPATHQQRKTTTYYIYVGYSQIWYIGLAR